MQAQPLSDLELLDQSLQTVSDMLDRVLAYVRSVLKGEVEGNAGVGRYLMDTLEANTEDLEKGGFNASLQVCFCFFGGCCHGSLTMTATGHSHDFLSRQPRPVASGSVIEISTGNSRIVRAVTLIDRFAD
jgi:hypothetical protein